MTTRIPFAGIPARSTFGLKERLTGRQTAAAYAELASSEERQRSEVLARQAERLAAIVDHARSNVPFYRAFWRDAPAGAGKAGPMSLEPLPVLTKAHVGAGLVQLCAEPPSRHRVPARTSGSTGARLTVYHDPLVASYHLAHSIRGRSWWGIRVGDSEVKYWGSALAFANVRGKAFAIARRGKDKAMGVVLLSPFHLSKEVLDQHFRILDQRRPRLLYGYGGALYALARHMRSEGLAFDGWKPAAVVYTSESLLPSQKGLMAEAFQQPVASEYGSVECGIIAYECPSRRMHLSDETLVVEVLPGTGRGLPKGWGEIALTHLRNRTMPLIRYNQGDLGVVSEDPCACGRPLGVLGGLMGRANDLLETPTGAVIHPEVFDYFMRAEEAVRRYRVVEEARGSLRVLVELDPALPRPKPVDLAARLAKHLGEGMHVTAELVPELSPDPSGKFRWVVPLQREAPP